MSNDFQIVLMDYANMIVLAGVVFLGLWLLLGNMGKDAKSDKRKHEERND